MPQTAEERRTQLAAKNSNSVTNATTSRKCRRYAADRSRAPPLSCPVPTCPRPDTGGRSGPHWVPLLTAPGSLGHMGKLCKIQKGNRIISMHTLSCSSSNAPPDITAERPVPPNAGPRQRQARKMCRGTRLTPVPRPTRHGEVRPHDAWMTPRSLLLGLRTAAGLRAHRPLSRALPKATDKLVLGV